MCRVVDARYQQIDLPIEGLLRRFTEEGGDKRVCKGNLEKCYIRNVLTGHSSVCSSDRNKKLLTTFK